MKMEFGSFFVFLLIVGEKSTGSSAHAFVSVCEKSKEDGQLHYNAKYENFRITGVSPSYGDCATAEVSAVPSQRTPFGATYEESCDVSRTYKVTVLGDGKKF